MPTFQPWVRPQAPSTLQRCDGCGQMIDTGWRLVGYVLIHHCEACHREYLSSQVYTTARRVRLQASGYNKAGNDALKAGDLDTYMQQVRRAYRYYLAYKRLVNKAGYILARGI